MVVIAAVLLVLMGAAGGAFAFLGLGQTVEAVAARVSIERGQELSAEMFTTVHINPDQQLRFIGPSEVQELIGLRAGHDIAAGALVGPDAARKQMIPVGGTTVVGLSLPPGAEPGIPLLVGDRVRVVLTEPTYACAAQPPVEPAEPEETSVPEADAGVSAIPECPMSTFVIEGQVVASARDDASGQVSVSVQVAEGDAARAAAAASMGRAALVLDSRES